MGPAMRGGLTQALSRPHRFIRTPEYQLVAPVYFGTYAVANLADTLAENRGAIGTRTHIYSKLATVTATNLYLCANKDRMFGILFSARAASAFPIASMMLFATRDILTMYASFVAPRFIAPRLCELGAGKGTAQTTAQLTPPIAMQCVASPLHLLACAEITPRSGTRRSITCPPPGRSLRHETESERDSHHMPGTTCTISRRGSARAASGSEPSSSAASTSRPSARAVRASRPRSDSAASVTRTCATRSAVESAARAELGGACSRCRPCWAGGWHECAGSASPVAGAAHAPSSARRARNRAKLLRGKKPGAKS